MKTKVQVKILKSWTKSLKVGDVVSVDIDAAGIPLDLDWRRRFKDAEIDNCLQVLSDGKAGKGKKGV